MMRSLYSAVSGLKTHQTRMDVIGNNIANVNTEAFKSSRVTFSEIMYQTTAYASGGNAVTGIGGVNAKQIGLGVTTGATSISITTAGAAETTGNPFDLKLTDSQSTNFFIVSDGTNNFFTRSGSYYVDGNGLLCMTSTGYTLMGWQVDETTGIIKKDTVSPLHVMSTKNQTSSPEATTKAAVSGILDKNDMNLTSSKEGYVMTLGFYDDLGYSYTARFSVKPKGTGDENVGKYTVSLTDVLDQNGKSIIYDSFGELIDPSVTTDKLFSTQAVRQAVDATGRPIYKSDATGTENVYQLNVAETNSYYTAEGKLYPVEEVEVDANGQVVVKGTTTPAEAIAVGTEIFYTETVDEETGEVLGRTILTDATGMEPVYADGEWNTLEKFAVTEENRYFVFDDNGKKVVFDKEDASTGIKYDPINEIWVDNKNREVTPMEIGEYFTYTRSVDNGSGGIKTENVLSSQHYEQYELIFDSNEGTFVSINNMDAVSLNMSLIKTNFTNEVTGRDSQFEDVSVDFTGCLNLNNGGTSTMGVLKGMDGDGAGKKLGALTGISIDGSGRVYGSYDNGNTILLCQVAVAQFSNASGLEKVGESCYQTTLNSGEFDGIGVEVSADGSKISTGVLEMSNVDLSAQFTDMIVTQRGFQANSRVITTSDSLLEELINLKR